MARVDLSELARALSRRDLLKGAAGGAALAATRGGGNTLLTGAAGGAAALLASSAGEALAQGVRSYTLTASAVNWTVGGRITVPAYAYSLNGGAPTVPGPTIRATAGETLQITVVNRLAVPTTVHWHGVHAIPNGMDGVPAVTQEPIPPGGSFAYRFPAPPPGTYVYHSHVDVAVQVPRGLYGLLVVDDPKPGVRTAVPWRRDASERRYDREYPLVLGDIQDAVGNAYHIINGKTFYGLEAVSEPANQGRLVFSMNRGERVLFRAWNASAAETHPMHTHGMAFAVVAADGMDLEVPVRRHNMGIDPGEGYDIIAHADNPGVWVFHCHNLHHAVNGMIAVNVVS